MRISEKVCVRRAMERPLLLDRGSGVYWDFDFGSEEFRVGTACNSGLIVDFTQRYEDGEDLDVQLHRLLEKAEAEYGEEEP